MPGAQSPNRSWCQIGTLPPLGQRRRGSHQSWATTGGCPWLGRRQSYRQVGSAGQPGGPASSSVLYICGALTADRAQPGDPEAAETRTLLSRGSGSQWKMQLMC